MYEDLGLMGEKDRKLEMCILVYDDVLYKIYFIFFIIGEYWLD